MECKSVILCRSHRTELQCISCQPFLCNNDSNLSPYLVMSLLLPFLSVFFSGDCNSGRVIRRWSGADVPDSIESTGSALCLRFVTDGSIRDKGFVISYNNTGGMNVLPQKQLVPLVTMACMQTCHSCYVNENKYFSWRTM